MKSIQLKILGSAVIAFSLAAGTAAMARGKNFDVPKFCEGDMVVPENVHKCGASLMRSSLIFGNITDNKLGFAVIPGVTDEPTRQKAVQARKDVRQFCKKNQLAAYNRYVAANDDTAKLRVVQDNVADQIKCMEISTDVIRGFEEKGRIREGMTAKAQAILDSAKRLDQYLNPSP